MGHRRGVDVKFTLLSRKRLQQRQRIFSVLKRELDRLSLALGFEDGDDHFGRGAGFVDAGFRLTVFFNRRDKIGAGGDVAGAVVGVFEWFGLADTGRGDG